MKLAPITGTFWSADFIRLIPFFAGFTFADPKYRPCPLLVKYVAPVVGKKARRFTTIQVTHRFHALKPKGRCALVELENQSTKAESCAS
jgi:hypothetical protein